MHVALSFTRCGLPQEDILAQALESSGDAAMLDLVGEGFTLETPQGLEWRAQGQGEVILISAAGASDARPPESMLGKLPSVGQPAH